MGEGLALAFDKAIARPVTPLCFPRSRPLGGKRAYRPLPPWRTGGVHFIDKPVSPPLSERIPFFCRNATLVHVDYTLMRIASGLATILELSNFGLHYGYSRAIGHGRG